MKRVSLMALMLVVTGCAFKQGEADSSPQQKHFKYEGFKPQDLRIKEGDKSFVLIDMIELPPGDYQIDRTKVVTGNVEYVYDYPVFTDTQCQGLGYSISYEARRRSVTSSLKLVIFKNQRKAELDHLVVPPNEFVQIAVYADQLPISEYVDSEKLPAEFVKTFQPSNQCHYICGAARVKPVRKLIFEAGRIDCTFWIWGADERHFPTTTWTDDLAFNPAWFEQAQMRDAHLKQLQTCDGVRSNDDLKSYYQQATEGACVNGSVKTMLREWYFVEQRIPYRAPVYSITNFSEIVKNTAATQNDGIQDRAVHLFSDWSN